MLELCGRSYLVEHCAITANERAKAQIYNMYMADTVHFINHSVSGLFGGNVKRERYSELIKPQVEETRTADEIINHVTDKLRKIAS